MQQDSHQHENSASYQHNTNNHQENTSSLFKLDLHSSQAAYLSKLLPSCYSFQLQPKPTKKAPSQKGAKDEVSIPLETKKKTSKEEMKPSNSSKANPSRNQKNMNNKYNEEIENAVYQKYNAQKQITRRNTYQGIPESLKPCIKILNQLKNSRTSWPFREPVDPVALGIPHYTEIVKQPIDLSTIENNLRTNQYLTPTQFHADVSRIITNSYTFNSSDIEFTRITAQFQSYYRKIIQQSTDNLQRGYSYTEMPSELYNNKSTTEKKRKKEGSLDNELAIVNTTISMNEKKELGLNIKKLPKEHMKGILDIVNEGKVKTVGEFDLKQLDSQVIRKLQLYVKEKLSGQVKNKQIYGQQKVKENRDKQESSFEIDEEDES